MKIRYQLAIINFLVICHHYIRSYYACVLRLTAVDVCANKNVSIPHSPYGRSLEIPGGGGGGLKAKFYEEKHEA